MKVNKLRIMFLILILANVVSAQKGTAYLIDKTVKITIVTNVEDVKNISSLAVKIYDKTTKTIFQQENLKPTLNINDADVPDDDAIELVFDLNSVLNPQNEYEARVFSSGFLWKKFDLKPLSAEFSSSTEFSVCKGAIPLFLNGIEENDENPVLATKFWKPILAYLKEENLEKKISVKTSFGETEQNIKLKSALLVSTDLVRVSKRGNVLICLDPTTKPSSGDFNISVKFVNPPFSLGGEFIGENLSWGGTTAIESSDALPDAPDERELENNLDIGLSFTSAVETDSTTNQKKRESRGILDVRFAPILNTIKYRGGPWIKKWTPFYLNANVATGKITESTLSLNRVILGTEFEFRYIPNLQSPSSNRISDTRVGFIDYYRFKFNGRHSSDRDFKQKEITGKAEFQPVWAILNKPRDTNWRYVDDKITGNKIVEYGTFGWEIVPKIGVEFGKTYSRRNPASAITQSDFIKRLYGGIEMKFDITSHFSLSIEDTLYSRYELQSDRLKNYFKSQLFAPIGNPFRESSHGLFLSFEKGDAPPFTNTVNVVKFGYRIQSNYGFGFKQ